MHRICCFARRRPTVRGYRAGAVCAHPSPCAGRVGVSRGRAVARLPSAKVYPQVSDTPFATPWPPTCWRTAPTCATCR
jgi:hypothetical protein